MNNAYLLKRTFICIDVQYWDVIFQPVKGEHSGVGFMTGEIYIEGGLMGGTTRLL